MRHLSAFAGLCSCLVAVVPPVAGFSTPMPSTGGHHHQRRSQPSSVAAVRSRLPLSLPRDSKYALRHHQNRVMLFSSSSPPEPSEEDEDKPDESSSKISSAGAGADDRPRWKRWLNPKNKSGEDDGLTFRQRLAKMGLAAVLSYGWVSNMSYVISISVAWFIFSKQTGKSPLAPGQWKSFLAVYAGFWVFNNIVRPVRLAAAVAISPYFDKIVKRIEVKFRVNKTLAIAITVFIANIVMTTSLMCAGVTLASLCAGVPIFAR